ncbi:MAG: hypothetical protein MZV70_18930 [Desulfobacterales bacterium]|nr:hypothetical protein [Desulfobacterales bacterium]
MPSVQCAATAFAIVLLWSRVLKRQHTGALLRGAARLGRGPVFRLGHGGRLDPQSGSSACSSIAGRAFPPGVAAGAARLCLRHPFRQLPHLRHGGPGDAAVRARERAALPPGSRVCFLGAVVLIVAIEPDRRLRSSSDQATGLFFSPRGCCTTCRKSSS